MYHLRYPATLCSKVQKNYSKKFECPDQPKNSNLTNSLLNHFLGLHTFKRTQEVPSTWNWCTCTRGFCPHYLQVIYFSQPVLVTITWATFNSPTSSNHVYIKLTKHRLQLVLSSKTDKVLFHGWVIFPQGPDDPESPGPWIHSKCLVFVSPAHKSCSWVLLISQA